MPDGQLSIISQADEFGIYIGKGIFGSTFLTLPVTL